MYELFSAFAIHDGSVVCREIIARDCGSGGDRSKQDHIADNEVRH
jgi:hypothetical protein